MFTFKKEQNTINLRFKILISGTEEIKVFSDFQFKHFFLKNKLHIDYLTFLLNIISFQLKKILYAKIEYSIFETKNFQEYFISF